MATRYTLAEVDIMQQALKEHPFDLDAAVSAVHGLLPSREQLPIRQKMLLLIRDEKKTKEIQDEALRLSQKTITDDTVEQVEEVKETTTPLATIEVSGKINLGVMTLEGNYTIIGTFTIKPTTE